MTPSLSWVSGLAPACRRVARTAACPAQQLWDRAVSPALSVWSTLTPPTPHSSLGEPLNITHNCIATNSPTAQQVLASRASGVV